MRSAVRKELEEQAPAQARRNLEESVVEPSVEQAKVEPPQTWVEQQAQALRESTQQRLKDQGLYLEQILQLSEPDRSRPTRRSCSRTHGGNCKRTLVLNAVADAEGITVSDEEVDAAIERQRPVKGKSGSAREEG